MASMQATWGQKIVLHMTDKKTVEYNISQLDSISFLEGTNEEIKEDKETITEKTLFTTTTKVIKDPIFDKNKFAGEGNIGHMLCQVNINKKQIFEGD